MLGGLLNPGTFELKSQSEAQLLQQLRARPELAPLAEAWQLIEAIQLEKRELLVQSVNLRSELFAIALQIVLLGTEDTKPNEQRLRGYTDAARESLLQSLLSSAPIYDDLEQVKLADELARLIQWRGGDDPLVQQILDGNSPRQLAAELVNGTTLADVAERKKLIDGGQDTIAASDDPMIALAQILEPEYRRIRELNENIEERERQAYAKISEAVSSIEGTDGYPDATFTLRLAFGVIKGYQEDGRWIEPTTDFAGAYQHAADHAGQADFDLPQSWLKAKDRVNLQTQLNFVCTADIIGGNSGSPVVNRNGELVGLIFDGNIQSLTSDYLYSDDQARAVSVAGVGIMEALRSIYERQGIGKPNRTLADAPQGRRAGPKTKRYSRTLNPEDHTDDRPDH